MQTRRIGPIDEPICRLLIVRLGTAPRTVLTMTHKLQPIVAPQVAVTQLDASTVSSGRVNESPFDICFICIGTGKTGHVEDFPQPSMNLPRFVSLYVLLYA